MEGWSSGLVPRYQARNAHVPSTRNDAKLFTFPRPIKGLWSAPKRSGKNLRSLP